MKRHMKPLALTTCTLLLSAMLALPAPARAETKKDSGIFRILGGLAALATVYTAWDAWQHRQAEARAREEAEQEKARREARERARMMADPKAVAPYVMPPIAAPNTRY